MFIQKDLNLQEKRLLELLKDYDMSVLSYHPDKANVIIDSLSRMSMGSVSHVEKEKKELVKDVHRFARLDVCLEDSPNGGFMVYHNSDSSLVVDVESKKHLVPLLMELKDFLLGKLNDSLSQGGWCSKLPREIMCTICRGFEKSDSRRSRWFSLFYTSGFHQNIS